MTYQQRIYRQGDILLIPAPTIPTSLTNVPLENGRLVLAHGEVTGHAHVLEGQALFLAADLDDLSERFLRVETEAQLVHDEHDTIIIPPGDYQVVRQREYQPQVPQWVAD